MTKKSNLPVSECRLDNFYTSNCYPEILLTLQSVDFCIGFNKIENSTPKLTGIAKNAKLYFCFSTIDILINAHINNINGYYLFQMKIYYCKTLNICGIKIWQF